MNSKLQFVTSGGFEWCIKGLLPPQKETSLSKLCNVIKRITSPQFFIAELPSLQADTHEALALFRRDFPLSMQNLTTHLIHHFVDDLSCYGPMHGRWLFPYERANAWITRQCLRKGMEKSTVMETYVVYDWCVFMILSRRFDPSKLFNSDKTLVRVSQHIMDNVKEGLSITATVNSKNNEMRASLLTQEMESYMTTFYVQNLKLSTIYGFSKTVAENHSTLDITDDSGRRLCYIGENYRGKKTTLFGQDSGEQQTLLWTSIFLLETFCVWERRTLAHY